LFIRLNNKKALPFSKFIVVVFVTIPSFFEIRTKFYATFSSIRNSVHKHSGSSFV